MKTETRVTIVAVVACPRCATPAPADWVHTIVNLPVVACAHCRQVAARGEWIRLESVTLAKR